MLLALILAFVASVLVLLGVSRLFRVWIRSRPKTSGDQLAKDAKMMDAAVLTDAERLLLRERMKQKLQQELKH